MNLYDIGSRWGIRKRLQPGCVNFSIPATRGNSSTSDSALSMTPKQWRMKGFEREKTFPSHLVANRSTAKQIKDIFREMLTSRKSKVHLHQSPLMCLAASSSAPSCFTNLITMRVVVWRLCSFSFATIVLLKMGKRNQKLGWSEDF